MGRRNVKNVKTMSIFLGGPMAAGARKLPLTRSVVVVVVVIVVNVVLVAVLACQPAGRYEV